MAAPSTSAKKSNRMAHEFWKSAGVHLVEKNETGWLRATPDLIRAYLTRPEVHPIDESCAAEIATFEALMEDPFLVIPDTRLATFEDSDAADNYRIVLGFRDVLKEAGTLEGAYLNLMRSGSITVPPVFIDQIVPCYLFRGDWGAKLQNGYNYNKAEKLLHAHL